MKSSRDVLSSAAQGVLATVFIVFVHTIIILSKAVRPPWTHHTRVDLHCAGGMFSESVTQYFVLFVPIA